MRILIFLQVIFQKPIQLYFFIINQFNKQFQISEMITGKKITDSVINCKIIKPVTVSQTQERNVSQYFVNKNIKMQPQPVFINNQTISQSKKEQTKLQNHKENQVSNQIQIHKSQNLVQNTKNIKNQKIQVQKQKKNPKVQKKNQTVKYPTIKQVKKTPSIQPSKSVKLLGKVQTKINNQVRIPQKMKDMNDKKLQNNTEKQGKKGMNKKQNQIKSEKKIKNQVQKTQRKENPTTKRQNLTDKQKMIDLKMKKQQQNLDKEEQVFSMKNIQLKKQQEFVLEHQDDDQHQHDKQCYEQEQERIIPTPIQLTERQLKKQVKQEYNQPFIDYKLTQKNESQTNNQEQISFNQFLGQDLVYSKIRQRTQQQECFIKQNDSICLFKQSTLIQQSNINPIYVQGAKINKNNTIKTEQRNQVQDGLSFQKLQRQSLRQSNINRKYPNNQNQPINKNQKQLIQSDSQVVQSDSQIVELDQNYLNFQLSFEQTLLINHEIIDNKSLQLQSSPHKQHNLITLVKNNQYNQNQNQSMLLQSNISQNTQNQIYQQDNYILNQTSQQISNIIKSITFSQTLPKRYAHFKYQQSSDEDYNDNDEDNCQQNKDNLTFKKNCQKQFIQTAPNNAKNQSQNHSMKKNQKVIQTQNYHKNPSNQLKQLNQNSSQQESQQENQAIQEYLRARNLVSVDKPKTQSLTLKHQNFHVAVKTTQYQNNTIIQQSFQQDSSLLILESSKKQINDSRSINESQISQDLSSMQLFSLGMQELMKKDFIMI